MLISAGRIFEIMGRETRALRVPHDGSPASLRRKFRVVENGATGPDEYLVDPEILPYLISPFRQLGKLSELGVPPVGQRQPTSATRTAFSGWKCGWRELGLDGDVADWYVFIQ